MKKNIFFSMFKAGLLGFGGGNALIPIIQKEVVEDNKLITEEEYEEDVLIANLTPGALTIKLASGVGSRIAGWKGAILGALGMTLPGLILSMILMIFVTNAGDKLSRQINYITIGITAYIACLLTDYVVKTIHKAKGGYRAACLCITILVFLLTCGKKAYKLFGIRGNPLIVLSTFQIFVISIGVVVLASFFTKKKKNENKLNNSGKIDLINTCKEITGHLGTFIIFSIPAIMITMDTVKYIICSFVSSLLSFGGGDAYLTVADSFFVGNDIILEATFYGRVVPFANLIPGSILAKVSGNVGYMVGSGTEANIFGGVVVAIAGMFCSILASCGVFCVVRLLYRRFGEFRFFALIKKWIKPVVSGLMLTVILSLVGQVKSIGTTEGLNIISMMLFFMLFLINVLIFYKQKCSNFMRVFISIVLSCILCNIM